MVRRLGKSTPVDASMLCFADLASARMMIISSRKRDPRIDLNQGTKRVPQCELGQGRKCESLIWVRARGLVVRWHVTACRTSRDWTMSKGARPHHSNKAKLEGSTMPSNELGESSQKTVPLAAPYYLAVDRQLKSGYGTFEKAEKAGLAIKRQHPRLLVSVYEAERHQHIVIEQPKVAINGKRVSPTDNDGVARYPVSATRH